MHSVFVDQNNVWFDRGLLEKIPYWVKMQVVEKHEIQYTGVMLFISDMQKMHNAEKRNVALQRCWFDLEIHQVLIQ